MTTHQPTPPIPAWHPPVPFPTTRRPQIPDPDHDGQLYLVWTHFTPGKYGPPDPANPDLDTVLKPESTVSYKPQLPLAIRFSTDENPPYGPSAEIFTANGVWSPLSADNQNPPGYDLTGNENNPYDMFELMTLDQYRVQRQEQIAADKSTPTAR